MSKLQSMHLLPSPLKHWKPRSLLQQTRLLRRTAIVRIVALFLLLLLKKSLQ